MPFVLTECDPRQIPFFHRDRAFRFYNPPQLLFDRWIKGKSSWNQTSVQWTAAASQLCQERCQAAQLEPHGGRLFLTCSALADSITAAVHSGSLSVVDTDAR